MEIQQTNFFKFLEKHTVGKAGVILLEFIGISVTIYEFQGIIRKDLRFLGIYASSPYRLRWIIGIVSLLILLACLFIILNPKDREKIWTKPKIILEDKTKIIAVVVFITNLIGVVILFSTILRYDTADAPQKEDGVTIFVSTFGEGPDLRQSVKGKEMTAFISRSLRREIERSSLNVNILNSPIIRSDRQALDIGREKGANIVLWGWVSNTGQETLFPTFTFLETECES